MEVQVPSLATVTTTRHVLVVPYPSRGHINPMMNLCKLLVSQNTDILVTFVVTEQWLRLIATEPKPHNIRLASLPNIGPSSDTFANVVEAVMTKMEAPLELLLHRLNPPPTTILCDAFLYWAIAVGNRRNIPVAAFWTTTTSELWVQYFHVFQQNLDDHQKLIDYIPSTSWIDRAYIPLLDEKNRQILQWAQKCCEWLSKAQYLLLPSIYELESQVTDALRARISMPIYTIGPNIPYFNLGEKSCYTNDTTHDGNYIDWLDGQPVGSVLYISYGSFHSVSRAQMDEIVAALHKSNVRFLWVTREETNRLKEICGDMGLVVAWCDQLRVLLHPSVGGYWTHCGWNSVVEGVYAGVPFLTFPIAMDQPLISKLIVEDWKVGWRVKKDDKLDTLVRRDEIVVLLRKFMHLDSDVGRDMRKRAKELQDIAQKAIAKDGSSEINFRAFMKNILVHSEESHESNGPQVQNGVEKLN
ncbi:UDP-glycosyltransferase 87A1-like [Abrus precatorius]|uniref:UDP-glycosyltransferase 87A1-like n=1 Tax=Abrus precatorius TaxID=3816 RepID=A0A8B8K372_ABRPR|nr:UDP-glycosyltransferase 87A1-like [Abrus precatorius]